MLLLITLPMFLATLFQIIFFKIISEKFLKQALSFYRCRFFGDWHEVQYTSGESQSRFQGQVAVNVDIVEIERIIVKLKFVGSQ